MFGQIYDYYEVSDIRYLMPIYLIFQGVIIYKYKRIWRWLASVPLVPMLFVFIITGTGYFANSNLWPLIMYFAIAPAIMYLVLLSFIYYLYHWVNNSSFHT